MNERRFTRYASLVQSEVRRKLVNFFNGLLTGLSVEETGFISREVELGVLLVDPFIAVDSVLLRITPHRMVPPIEQGLDFRLIHGIAVAAARILLNQSAGHIIDLPVAFQGIEENEQAGFVVIELIDARVEIRLSREGIFPPSCRGSAP
jgi:hypothetical protein